VCDEGSGASGPSAALVQPLAGGATPRWRCDPSLEVYASAPARPSQQSRSPEPRTFGAREEDDRRPPHGPELAPQARERRLAAAARWHVVQVDQHSRNPLPARRDALAPRARRHVKSVEVGEVELARLVARDLRRLLRGTHG
jgi:hypothetical protein